MAIRRISSPSLRRVTPSIHSTCFHCTSTLPPENRLTPICHNCILIFRSILTSSRWRDKVRQAYFAENPFCIHCPSHLYTQATDIDHIKPWRFYPELFWDQSNWQSLCHSCHSKKTISENTPTQFSSKKPIMGH
jgi:5-methylcytosine-specific restriction endonuclease McrA